MELLEKMSNHLFDRLAATFKSSGVLDDDILSALDTVHPSTLYQALQLVDSKSVTRIISPSGRSIFRVMGSSGTPYYCYSTLEYCPCLAFQFSTINRSECLFCKHLLAIKLCLATVGVVEQRLEDNQISQLFVAID